MKTCTRCQQQKQIEDFALAKKNKDGRASECKVCHRVRTKEHYYKNTAVYIKKAKRRKHEVRTLLAEMKNVPCRDCRGVFPSVVMDFDHVSGEKSFNISNFLIRGGYSMQQLKDELEKCEVVCSNCHRLRTHFRIENRHAMFGRDDD